MLGRIYKITSPSTDKIYIGSTTTTLNKRFGKHKTNKILCSSSEIINYGNAIIELLEEFECQDKNELLWKERKYQDQFKESCVNKMRAITTKDEKKIKKYEWVQNNHELLLERGKEYRKKYREKSKEYYQINKEKMKEKSKRYREKKKLEVQIAN